MTQALVTAVQAALADPLAQVRGATAPIAYVGLDVPLDLLYASGRAYCHLPWQRGRATPQADRWLESAFPGWARSIMEDWLGGAFDCFDSVIFTRGDDAAQRLYYYLCELQRRGLAGGPRPLIFDTALIPRATSVEHCARAVRALMAELEIDDAALAAGITQANRQRGAFARLAARRAAPGHLFENIARAALFRDLTPLLENALLAPAQGARRLVLGGSVPPDDLLHRAAEASGWNVVGETHQLTLTRHGAAVGVDHDDPVPALARHCNTLTGGARAFSARATQLVATARELAADAVVLWLTEEDEAQAWHVARQRAALTDAGIPHLIQTRRHWDGSDGAAAELGAFLEDLPA